MASTMVRPARADRMARIAAAAAAQHGVLSRRQLRAAGFSDRTIARWAETGRLVRAHPRSFVMAGAPPTYRQSLMAAVLACEGKAVASHRSAARLWGLVEDETVEVTVERDRLPRLQGVVVHRPLDLWKARTTARDGIPVTNPLRTLADLGAVLPTDAVAEAVEQALITRLVTFRGLCNEWRRIAKPGRSGSGVLRTILDNRLLGDKPADSVLEPRAAPIFALVGGPRPVFQHEVSIGGRRFRLDFAYPDLKIAVEFDGLVAHATAAALQADLRRQNALLAAGWLVLRFTWDDVVRRPDRVALEISRVVAARRAAA